jgi:hypothetical protein
MMDELRKLLLGAFWLVVFGSVCAAIVYLVHVAALVVPAGVLAGIAAAALFVAAAWLVGDIVGGS